VTKHVVLQDQEVLTPFHWADITFVVRVTVGAESVNLALPHKYRPNDAWIEGLLKKCQEYCGPRYSHFERTAAAFVLYRPLKRTPLFYVPKESNQGDSGLLNNLVRILAPAFLSVAQCMQSQGSYWRCDSNGLGHLCMNHMIRRISRQQCSVTGKVCSEERRYVAPLIQEAERIALRKRLLQYQLKR
jgi:hypothetical protein